MSILATADDFEGLGVEPFYTQYQDYQFFQDRANYILSNYVATRIVVLGSGPGGYLVQKLVTGGRTAVGVDLSPYARDRHQLVHGSLTRFELRDGALDSDYQALRSRFGLNRNQKIPLIVTEDMLGCCTSDSEAQLITQLCRLYGGEVLHIITCSKPGDVIGNLSSPPPELPATATLRTARLLWHTLAGWRGLIGNDGSVILDTETGATA